MSISVVSPKHDESRWFAIPKDIREDLSLQETYEFPNLESLCKETIEEIIAGLLPGTGPKEYRESIQDHGGVYEATRSLLKLIAANVRGLEGLKVSREVLYTVLVERGDKIPWNRPVGYASFVTDVRQIDWWRMYCGQCFLAWRRIMCQHTQAILRSSTSSLHYYILWIGNGNRTAHFFKLWEFPEDTLDDSWYQIRSNILEAVFCKAFRTHHGMLNRIDCLDSRTKSYGLNIMTPLVQGYVTLSKALRVKANAGPSQSPDAQIKHWATFNPSKKKKIQRKPRPIFQCDFGAALEIALGDKELFQDVIELLRSPGYPAQPDLCDSIPFAGSLQAAIGFVLDYAAVSVANDSPLESVNSKRSGDLPWPIQGCGFHQNNVLVWTYNFKRFSSLTPNDFITTEDSEKSWEEFHRILLGQCAAKIILLCGPRAGRIIKAVIEGSSQYNLDIQGYTYQIFLDHKRLYIRCPELPAEIWSIKPTHAARLSDVVRFSTSLLNITDIRPYFVESSSIVGYILCQARKERLGGHIMTTDDLDTGVRLWLTRKGIGEDADIREIETIAGSLVRGLLMLLHALPRRKDGVPTPKRPPFPDIGRERTRVHENFDAASYKKIKELVHDRVATRDKLYLERLSSLPMKEADTTEDIAEATAETPQTMIIETLFQIDDKEVTGMQTWLSKHQKETIESYEHSFEARVEDLTPLINQAITDGFLDPNIDLLKNLAESLGVRTSRKGILRQGQTTGKVGCSRKIWRNEREVFQNKEYKYIVPLGMTYERSISLNYCPIKFPSGMDVGDGTIYVKIEICPFGQRHPEVYATSATDEDPACRLAFHVRFTDSTGSEVKYYERNTNTSPLFRANTFVDILANDVPDEQIARTPRRYLHFKKGKSPAGLEGFEGGSYTTLP
ncbi:hypothetical protein BDV34DRAFT_220017 [Aspergillus parasiticus]|uniref:Uncharacterized protein n=1 Tax=Aspergillus parasiticus TaxID=5067 RepID=A0A5N6E069_ASPPA|nr:hypothetical protein BDV34DRAFT_220017 [Aspergillus parasiticus]